MMGIGEVERGEAGRNVGKLYFASMNVQLGDFLTVDNNRAVFHGFRFTIPENYTCYAHREESQHFSVGIGMRPIGVLTVNQPLLMSTSDEAQEAFDRWGQQAT